MCVVGAIQANCQQCGQRERDILCMERALPGKTEKFFVCVCEGGGSLSLWKKREHLGLWERESACVGECACVSMCV